MIARVIAATLAAAGLASAVNGQAADYDPTISVVSTLGIESTFQVTGTSVDDEIASSAYPFYSGFLSIAPTEGVIVMAPLWSVQSASRMDGRLQLSFTNGTTIEGAGVGQVFGPDNQAFSLNSVQQLTVVTVPADFKDMIGYYEDESADQPWRLTVGAPGLETSYLVRDPRFAFQYYSSEGYIMGGSNQIATGEAQFGVEIDGSRLVASLTAFERISLSATPEIYGAPAIALRAPNGTESAGLLALSAEDSEGDHEFDPGFWAVYGWLDGQTDVMLLVLGRGVQQGASITLERAAAP